MEIFNALQVKAGAKVDKKSFNTLTQPLQFLPEKEKTDDWMAWNIDYLEYQGLKQIKKHAKRLMKNYNLAKGIIDKTDYIVEEDNEYADVIDVLTKEDDSALELKFYPIIPNVINVLCTEFSKRTSKITIVAVDDLSYNEMLDQKRSDIEQVLLQQAQFKVGSKLMEMGLTEDSEEWQQQMSQDGLKTLPEIEEFYKKDYRSIPEIWANHQLTIDTQRFNLEELEQIAFRDSLITDREYWHFQMYDDDYEVELWNPVTTFIFKSPQERYASNASSAGNSDLMTVADVIDTYGWLMDQEQLESLESIYSVYGAPYAVEGYQNDGSFYDHSKTHEWNTQIPDSLGMRQYKSFFDMPKVDGDIVKWIYSNEDEYEFDATSNLLRVTTVYWKTQKKYGHLVKITELGEEIQDIITEDYKITDKPVYDTTIYKNKTKNNVIFGEHIDWFYINEVLGGVKIGLNSPSAWYNNANKTDRLNPIYLGIKTPKPGRVPFQFKGDNSLYGCKLPIEGTVFSERNTKSVAMVDNMKPFQIGYNIVNNQVADILVDELGTVILLDQNGLPKHSMGEDWGKNNLANAYVAMKNFQMLPLDTSISNTENALNFQHYQVLNMEQTGRLMSRIQLATYFKNQAFEVVGITPQRLGQQIGQETATGVEQAVSSSYAQTEIYFTQHSDYLMPRVHQMRTDLAQFYNSTKPSIRLQYSTTNDEKINFQMNGTKLLLRDFNIFAVTNNNTRDLMDKLKSLAVNNNTTGASIYDLGNIMKSNSMAELTTALKESEDKLTSMRQEDQSMQERINQANLESQERQKQEALAFEADQNEKDRQKDILVAEIRATSQIGGNKADMDGNSQNDQIDALNYIQEQANYREQTDLQREKQTTDTLMKTEELNIKKQEIASRQAIAQKQLEIARENKNKFDRKK